MATGLRQDEETAGGAWFGRRRVLGAVVVVLVLITVAVTADVLADGLLRHWDRSVMFGTDHSSVTKAYYDQHALRIKSGLWFWVWRTIVAGGQYWLLALLCGVAGLIVAVRRRNFWMLVAVGAWIVADQGVVWLFKKVIGRTFPLSYHDALYTSAQAFPSGHSALGASCLIVLAALLPAVLRAPDEGAMGAGARSGVAPEGGAGVKSKVVAWLATPGRESRASVAAERYAMRAANVLAVLVAISVVMLGYHWPTDAIAGWSFGILVGLVGYGVVRRFE